MITAELLLPEYLSGDCGGMQQCACDYAYSAGNLSFMGAFSQQTRSNGPWGSSGKMQTKQQQKKEQQQQTNTRHSQEGIGRGHEPFSHCCAGLGGAGQWAAVAPVLIAG
jgi:hypothetical protein